MGKKIRVISSFEKTVKINRNAKGTGEAYVLLNRSALRR